MIAGNAATREIQKEGIEDSFKMRLAPDGEATNHIIKVLTENYLDPIGSHIRESVSNHWDSHFMNGTPENPIFIRIYRNETGHYTLETEDSGLGMDNEDFDKYYMQLGCSSKRGIAQAIGKHGCGAKAALSKVDNYEVITRKNGQEWKFLVYKGDEVPERTIIYQKETDKPNGVIVKINFDRYDYSDFLKSVKKQLCYFPTCVFDICGDNSYNNYKIYQNDLFKWSEMYPDTQMHLSFGDCYYPISWESLKISKLYIPIAIKIPIDSGIDIQFNREQIVYNKFSREYILNKIKEISEWFVNKYNENTPDEKELLEAWDDITTDSKSVTLANQEFCIDDLIQYSIIKPKELKIHNINIESPNYYHRKGSDIGDEYECIADYDRGKWKTKHIRSVHNLRDKNKKHILVNSTPTGRLKQFLLQKHSGNRVLFIKKINTRKLGGKYVSIGSIDYKNILNLVMRPKNTWRQRIIEWQYVENQFKSLIIDERNCLESKEFLEFVELKKEEAKENRKSVSYVSNSNYVRINKEKGDVTIQVAKSKDKGYGCKFVKEAVRVENLDKLHKSSKALHIYFPEEQKERASQFYKLFHVKYSICILSKNELKRLKEIKPRQFMTEQQFIESRAFCKTMTSLKFDKALDTYKDIYYRTNSEIIENVLYKFKNQKEELQKYVNANGRSIDDDLLGELKEIAELKGLYDHSLDDVYNEFVNNIKKYEFISCLSKPRSWDSEEVAKYNKLINSLLLLKSKYNNYEDLEIEVKEKPISVLPVVEELVLEESN